MIKLLRKWFPQPPQLLAHTHRTVLARFTYVEQPNEWALGKVLKVHGLISRKFSGDCDDFAATMANLTGGEYAEVRLFDGRRHAVCIYQGWVSDNMNPHPYRVSRAPWSLVFSVKLGSQRMYDLGYLMERMEK